MECQCLFSEKKKTKKKQKKQKNISKKCLSRVLSVMVYRNIDYLTRYYGTVSIFYTRVKIPGRDGCHCC